MTLQSRSGLGLLRAAGSLDQVQGASKLWTCCTESAEAAKILMDLHPCLPVLSAEHSLGGSRCEPRIAEHRRFSTQGQDGRKAPRVTSLGTVGVELLCVATGAQSAVFDLLHTLVSQLPPNSSRQVKVHLPVLLG